MKPMKPVNPAKQLKSVNYTFSFEGNVAYEPYEATEAWES